MKEHSPKQPDSRTPSSSSHDVLSRQSVPLDSCHYPFDDWVRLRRFLQLGSEKSSYNALVTDLSPENTRSVRRCIQEDGESVIQEILHISDLGLAARSEPIPYVLALCASIGSEETRRRALDVLPIVCRTGMQLFLFARYVDGMRGWGRGLRTAIGRWYSEQSVKEVAYQAVRCNMGAGWSHRDLLRLSHPKPDSEVRKILYHWMTQGWDRIGDAPHDQKELQIIWAMEKAKLPGTTAKTVAELVRTYDLPREAIPTVLLGEKLVWEAMLERMPLQAILKNLPTLTRVGIFESRVWLNHVAAQISDGRRLKTSRVHPIAVLSALKHYEFGHGERGRHNWTPHPKILEALDSAFYTSFRNVESTGKRWLITLDVSGSMAVGSVMGVPGLSPLLASSAMALITAGTESAVDTLAFTTRLARVSITPNQKLADLEQGLKGLSAGNTDCALPMLWAMENHIEADVFVVYTDRVTHRGEIPASHALQRYREVTGIPARLIVVGMAGDDFSVADPDDEGMMDVVGFDTSAPNIMANFVRG